MAELEFAIPKTDIASIDTGVLGSTAESTAPINKLSGQSAGAGAGGGGGGSFGPAPSSGSVNVGDVSTTVTTDDLESGGSVNLPPTTTVQPIDVGTTISVEEETPKAEAPKEPEVDPEIQNLRDEGDDLRSDIQEGFSTVGDRGSVEEDFAKQEQLDAKRTALTNINNRMRKKERQMDLELRAIEDEFGTRAQKQARKNETTRVYNRELADLAIQQMAHQGAYNDALAIVTRKTENEMSLRRANLDGLIFLYQENRDRLTRKEDREWQEKIAKDERDYQREYNQIERLETFKLSLIQTALANGAGGATLSMIQKADSMEAIMKINGLSGALSSGGGLKAPTVKTINGVDMQWNSTTGEWEEISAGQQADKVQDFLNKLSFVKATVEQAKGIAGDTSFFKTPTGPSGIVKILGDTFIGDTRFRQLQTKQDTIQTNMLTLAGDPTIRDFFGPQMSEADVRMMVSASSNLNNANQDSKQYMTELQRIDEVLNRLETSARAKMNSVSLPTGNIITAPDGTIIEITDF